MSEENILKIQFEDITASQPGGGGQGAGGQQAGITPTAGGASPQSGGPSTPAHKRGNQPFDPIEAAQKRIMGEERKKEVDYYYNLAKHGNPAGPGPSGKDILRVGANLMGNIGVPGGGMLAGILGAAAPLAGLAAGAVALVHAFHKLDHAMENQMNRLAQFSPTLAIARAEADLTRMVGDMKRAQDVDLQNVLAGRERSKALREESGQQLQANVTKHFGRTVNWWNTQMSEISDLVNVSLFHDNEAAARIGASFAKSIGWQEKYDEKMRELVELERSKRQMIEGMMSRFDNAAAMQFDTAQEDENQRLAPVLEQL